VEKSHVSLLICVICNEGTGVLLDRRLQKSLEPRTTSPTEVCEKCREKYLKNGTMLINPKTGRLAVIRDEAFKRVFPKMSAPKKICFVESDEVFEKLGIKAGKE